MSPPPSPAPSYSALPSESSLSATGSSIPWLHEDVSSSCRAPPSYEASEEDVVLPPPDVLVPTRPPTPNTDTIHTNGLSRQPAFYREGNLDCANLSVEEASLYQKRTKPWDDLLHEIHRALDARVGAELPKDTLQDLSRQTNTALKAMRAWYNVERFLTLWPEHGDLALNTASAVQECGQQVLGELERVKARQPWFIEFQTLYEMCREVFPQDAPRSGRHEARRARSAEPRTLCEMCHRVFPRDVLDSERIAQEPGLNATSGPTEDITGLDSETDDPEPTLNPPCSAPQHAGHDSVATRIPGSTSNPISQRAGENDGTAP